MCIPQEYLADVSPFFDAAIQRHRQTDRAEYSLTVNGVPRVIVELFLEWLEHRALINRRGLPFDFDPAAPAEAVSRAAYVAELENDQTDLISLYKFATIYDVPQLRRDILDAFVQCYESLRVPPELEIILQICEDHEPGSPILKVLAAVCLKWWNPILGNDALRKDLQSVPNHFLIELLVAERSRGGFRGAALNLCDYHEHYDGELRGDSRQQP